MSLKIASPIPESEAEERLSESFGGGTHSADLSHTGARSRRRREIHPAPSRSAAQRANSHTVCVCQSAYHHQLGAEREVGDTSIAKPKASGGGGGDKLSN